MKFRLIRRRLTISAPRMSVRSAMPWPLRWALAAIVFGFCAAIALWAFEFGKDIAGLERGAKEELADLLGTRVQIKADAKRRGTLVLHFFGDEEFEGLVARLKGSAGE